MAPSDLEYTSGFTNEKRIESETIKSHGLLHESSLQDGSHSGTHVETSGLSWFNMWAAKLNAETKGVDMITDEEKVGDSFWNSASMWLSADLVVATYALGALGITVFDLTFWEATLVIIFFTCLGGMPVAWLSTFGPRSGLRQFAVLRFTLGDLGTRLFAAINVVACIGWGAVNIMSSAQLLHIVNNGVLPPWAGCLILVVCTIIITFFGYHTIHLYARWSWIPSLACFIAILVRMAMANNFHSEKFTKGPTTAGNILSFGGAIFGFAAGWSTYASDFTVYHPRNVSRKKIFISIFVGEVTPLLFALILGAACATGIDYNPRWKELYSEYSVGGLLFAVLVEDSLHGFGQFLCVVLAMTTVANNVPNMYSVSLSAQSIWSKFALIPRVVWTLSANFVTLAICIPGYYHFDAIMENFMNLFAYYLGIYHALFVSEHFIHNKGTIEAYDFDQYRNKNAYPKGYASLFGFGCGIAGVVLGMNQTWYSGVIARRIGEFGGDVGFELGFGFTCVGYNIARFIEKKYIGR